MKCFHFTSGERERRSGGGDGDDDQDGVVSRKVSWARSLSVASTNLDSRRSEFDTESRRDWADSSELFRDFLTQGRANDLRVFTFFELKSATRGFSRSLLIGEGGFGCVYRGRVKPAEGCNMTETCVNSSYQGHKEWINEVNFLGVVKHPNLVKLIGYCADDDERGIQRLLVYELMCNKSLEDHLLTRSSSSALPWIMRLKIAQDAARGLAYLHEEMEFQLIFRDFKTSNILLDEDFNAKLSDFGLARQGPAAGSGHVSTSVVGTVGYAAPEYVHTGRLTAKSDVWSFGVVLYELITGRRVLERNLPRGEQKLLEWVRPYVSDPKKFHLILDQRLEGQQSCMKSAQKLASLANKCLMKHPRSRPKMSEVTGLLGNIISEADECEINASVESVEVETGKTENNGRKKGFDFRDLVSRNRSIGKLDWRNWTPSLVRT
ncbi:probable receptor-like protein kinase at5g15080 [Phtheirospermum japonicum]|uniref:Probable receptor-like protein kinase at5g15080 n=1 Tax=Phtheirospermum japonicum TaxID=374723 RepID=A0A830B3S9_9LAMI|nr:probable receptor-like protein kinase at5g15080 [Phtheirospermum japonicum]